MTDGAPMTADPDPGPDLSGAGNRLLDAATDGDDRAVLAALEAGADIEHTNEYGFNALRSALWCAHLDSARLLVERGAVVGVDEAAALGGIDVLDATWPEDPPVEDAIGAYLMACRTGQVAVIRWFLAHGMPVDLHPPGDEWGGIGCPGLHHAADNGHLDAVRVLLDAGADPTLIDDMHSGTAREWAEAGGHAEVVRLLTDRS